LISVQSGWRGRLKYLDLSLAVSRDVRVRVGRLLGQSVAISAR